jgi:multiple sugar transport system substrate-binding protein
MVALVIVCSGCAPRTSGSAGRPGVTVITLWHPWGGSGKDNLLRIVDEFNKAHPTIRVQPLYTPNDLGSNQKFFTAVVADRAPDVIFVDGTQTAAWAEQGAILPLDERIKRSNIRSEDYIAPSWVQNCYKGHVWAMPYEAGADFALIWNKKVFREVGLDPDKAPETLAELDRYNDVLTKVVDGKIVRMGFIPWSAYGNANSLFTWGWLFGGDFYDAQTRRVTANDPNVVRALTWMTSYVRKYDIRKINVFASGFGSNQQNPLFTGQLAMACIHMGGLDDIERYAPNLDYGLGYLPCPPGGEKHCSWIGGWCLGIPKGSKHQDQAWEFIRWCCSDPKGSSIASRIRGTSPAYRKCPYVKEIGKKPDYGFFLKMLGECRHQRPVMPAQSFYMTSLDRAVDYAIYGTMTPKQALDKATRETQAELDLRLAGR